MRLAWRVRFVAGYVLMGVLAFGAVVAFAGQLKHPARHQPHTQSRETQGSVHGCDVDGHHISPEAGKYDVRCAKIGDQAVYFVEGRVVDVSEPQPGVVCVQLSSSKQVSQVCEPK